MKFPKEVRLHFETAKALLCGVDESMKFIERHDECNCYIPPEHSYESIMRRITQARQELMCVTKSVRNRWGWK